MDASYFKVRTDAFEDECQMQKLAVILDGMGI